MPDSDFCASFACFAGKWLEVSFLKMAGVVSSSQLWPKSFHIRRAEVWRDAELVVMNHARPLTEFQQTCERELCSALAARGLSLADRTLAGESETYLRASIKGTDIVIYIYEDEAQFHRDGKRAGVFEHQDYSDTVQLQEAFISGVIGATHDGSQPLPKR